MAEMDARKLSPEAQADLRRRVVSALGRGMNIAEAARTFDVSRQAVYNWLDRKAAGGVRALRPRKRGRPKGGTLEPWQCAQIAKQVLHHYPDQLKLPFFLWTRQAVAMLIAQRFGNELSVSTVGRYLRQWGFTPQKPLRRAYEQDPQQVRRWLKREYPRIRAQAKREKAEIYWSDEMGLRSDHSAGRSYGKRGQTPIIPGTGQRFRCNMISAISNRGRLYFALFTGRFTAGVLLGFLKRLVRQVKRKVYVIMDRHPVHRAAKVKRWLTLNAKKIRLYFLPSYSPELNPDEVLNQDVKTNALGRQRPRHQIEMMGHVRGYLRSTQRMPEVVKSYFHEPHVRYAAR